MKKDTHTIKINIITKGTSEYLTYTREPAGANAVERLELGAETIYEASGNIRFDNELTDNFVKEIYINYLHGEIQRLEEAN